MFSTEYSQISDHLNPSVPKNKKKPPTVFCYICSRQFGSKSIDIHEPKCLEKWKIENDKLPKHQRKPVPQRPQVKYHEDGTVDESATNEAAWEASQELLSRCEHCGRSFNTDRLAVHQRSCTADNPAKRAATSAKQK